MKAEFESLVTRMLASGLFLQDAVAIVEQVYITNALKTNKGNRLAAAHELGLHRNTLAAKMKRYHIKGK